MFTGFVFLVLAAALCVLAAILYRPRGRRHAVPWPAWVARTPRFA